jgi:exonuclease III
MSLISWNCRGLGNPRTVRDLDQMVKEKKPSFLFLMETISDKRRMERLRVKLGFAGLFAIDPVWRSGGLALLWREGKELEIQNYSRRHINAIVKRSDDGPKWKLTCFYGDPDSAKRKESWALLKHLKTFSPEAWLCVGDFNEITHQDEKTGEARRREGLMTDFRSALEECNLGDLGFIGPKFTWTNKRIDGGLTLVRLDRAVANEGWCELHRRAEVVVLAARASDHNPLLVMFEKTEQWSRGGNRNFKFKDRWWLDPECDKIIKDA